MGTHSIYRQLKAAGVPLDSHESDLYAKVTPISQPIVEASGLKWSIFSCQRQDEMGQLWYDIPFAFDPWWERRQA